MLDERNLVGRLVFPAEDTSRFAAFGVAQPSLIVENVPAPVLGWALLSALGHTRPRLSQ